MEKYGYKVRREHIFEKECEVAGLVERAAKTQGKWVIYDPSDNAEGYLLRGDFLDELVDEAVSFLELPPVAD